MGLNHTSKKTGNDFSFSHQATYFLCGCWPHDVDDRGHVDFSSSAESASMISPWDTDIYGPLVGFLVYFGVVWHAVALPENSNEKR